MDSGVDSGVDPNFDYAARGKIALRQAQQGFSANFLWRQHGPRYLVDVWGPLGQGRVQLSGDSQAMEIRRGDKLLAAGVPRDVMRQHLGWALPVAVIPAWLHGEPLLSGAGAPETLAVVDSGTSDKLSRSFAELGWQVDMTRFQPVASGSVATQALVTPRKIVAHSGTRKMTILVRQFSLFMNEAILQ